MYNRKGSQRERELVNWFDRAGFAVIRAPASGASTDRELPDVLSGNGEDFYAVEAKSSGKDKLYLTGEEVDALKFFAEKFGAKPRIAVRFDLKHGDPAYGVDEDPGWYFFDPDDLYVTPGGNYRVKKEVALESGVSFTELIGAEGREAVREALADEEADD